MKSITPVILFATLYLVVYTLLSNFESVPQYFIMSMFGVSPILVIYMVVRILKDGEPSELTWDEQFYEDKMQKRA